MRPTGVGLAEGVAVICVGDPNDVVQCVCVFILPSTICHATTLQLMPLIRIAMI